MATPTSADMQPLVPEETAVSQQQTEMVQTRDRFQVHFNRDRVSHMLMNRTAPTSQQQLETPPSTSLDPTRSPRPLTASTGLNPNSPVQPRRKRRFVKRTFYDAEVQTEDYGNDSDSSRKFLFLY